MKTHSVYFSGILADTDIQTAKEKLAKASHTSPNQFNSWFMGNEVCVKRNTSLEEAITIQKFLAGLGMATQIKKPIQGQVISLSANNPESFTQASEEILGGFWIRLLAVIIDVLALSIISWIIGMLINQLVANIFGCFMIIFYVVWMTCSSWQGTLGKRVLGLIVVDKNSERISYARSIVRYFVLLFLVAALIIGITLNNNPYLVIDHYLLIGTPSSQVHTKLYNQLTGAKVISSGFIAFGMMGLTIKRGLHGMISGTRIIYKKK